MADPELPSLHEVFGPSRPKFFPKAVGVRQGSGDDAHRTRARTTPGHVRPRHRSRYLRPRRCLDRSGSQLASLGGLPGRGPLPLARAQDLAWCGGDQLHRHEECRFGYYWNIPARCLRCPMFDRDRAERQLAGEGRPAPVLLEFELGPNLKRLLRGDFSAEREEEVPDTVPEEWEGI